MFEQTYTYSDLSLVPLDKSEIASRDDVDPSVMFAATKLNLPVVLAPMETVVGNNMVATIDKLGGLSFLPRSMSRDHEGELQYGVRAIPSISSKEYDYHKLEYSGCRYICIDVANGYTKIVEDLVKKIKNNYPEMKIITGNVGSVDGYKFLAGLGVYAVRIGIGGGSICTTSIQTGIGMGQASLVREVAHFRSDGWGPFIIADGGIKNAGDVCKAIALGADVVMVGGLFAGCDESPGRPITFGGKKYKQFAGEASFAVKKKNKYIEGGDTLVPCIGPAEDLWNNLEGGIRSCMSYLNCKTIEDLRYLPDNYFRLLSPSAKTERGVHANV